MRALSILIALAVPAAAHADGDAKPPVVAPASTAPAAPPGAPGTPAPPLATEPATEPAPAYSAVAVGLVPGLSTDRTRIGSMQHRLSLNLLVGVGGGSSGLSLSGIADIECGPVTGYQVGGAIASAPRLEGTQLAGVAALAGQVHGVQLAGAAAIASTSVDVQIAGATDIAGGTASVQIAGGINVAHRVSGLQLAAINVARQVDGAQIGAINIGGSTGGVQIGVINIGGSADGFSLGLVNLVPGGRADLETSVDSSKIGSVVFRHGGRRWHNVYAIGGHPVNHGGSRDDVWMYGLGFGHTQRLGDTAIDLEAIGWHVNHGAHYETDLSILSQLRLSVAHDLGPLALVAGGNLNVYVTSDAQSPLALERRTAGSPMTSGVTVAVWPSAFVGIRI